MKFFGKLLFGLIFLFSLAMLALNLPFLKAEQAWIVNKHESSLLLVYAVIILIMMFLTAWTLAGNKVILAILAIPAAFYEAYAALLPAQTGTDPSEAKIYGTVLALFFAVASSFAVIRSAK